MVLPGREVNAGDVVTLLSGTGGALGILVIIVGLMIGRVLVTKGELDDVKQERDEWKGVAETQQRIATSVLEQGAATRDVLTALQQVAIGQGPQGRQRSR